jgi:hypothetical protein
MDCGNGGDPTVGATALYGEGTLLLANAAS